MPLRTALCALCALAALLLPGPGSAVAGAAESGAEARRARPAAPAQVEDMTVGEDVGFVFAVDLGAVPGATYVQVLPGELPAGSRTAPDSEAAPLPEPAELQPETLQPGEEALEQPIEGQDSAVESGPEVTFEFEDVALRESSGEPAEEPGAGAGEEAASDRELVDLEEIPLHPGAAGDPEAALGESDELARSDRSGDEEATADGAGAAGVPQQDEAAADSGEATDPEPAEPAENPSAELARDPAGHAGDAEAPSNEPAAAAPGGGAAAPTH
jgi:hypothetical protein